MLRTHTAEAPTAAAASPERRHNTIIAYKGSQEFEAWLNDLADEAGLPVTVLVDQALRNYARAIRFKPMPRRIKRRGPARRAPAHTLPAA